MTQNEKDLLLKDLCARLPYGVKYNCSDIKNVWKLNSILTERRDGGVFLDIYNPLELCKPYLFPLSSMTEEQKDEFDKMSELDTEYIITQFKNDVPNWTSGLNRLNWLLKNHFDIYGLIPMGLALDATNLNIY